MIELKFNPEPKDLRLFGILLIPFSFLIGYLVRHYFSLEVVGWTLTGLLCGLGIVGTFLPTWIRWLFVGWMVLAFPIGWVVSHVVLALVFYGMFFPIGLVARMFGYDPLQLRSVERKTYWEEVDSRGNEPGSSSKESYFRQF